MNILNTIPADTGNKVWILVTVGLISVAALCQVGIHILEKEKIKAAIYGVIFTALICMFILTAVHKPPTRYELFVSDDSIPYTEFCKHWKVIKNEGGIITAERLDPFPICDECREQYDNDFTIFCPNCGAPIRWKAGT